MKTIAIVNQKGGCGKTTISINLASSLARLGHKTLLVDMDPQSHCAVGLAVPEEQIEQSIYDVLINQSRKDPARITEILWQINDSLELAPASLDLSSFEVQMTGIDQREYCLKKVLEPLNGTYEFCIIDCPPAVGLLTFNALRAATECIVPVETGYFALHGLSKQLQTLDVLCRKSTQQMNVKVLASMYDIRTKMAREVLGELRKHFDDKMFKTVVNFNTKIKEAASFGQPICEYDPSSKGQADFSSLAQEVLGKQAASQQNKQIVNSLTSQLQAISTSADEILAEAKMKNTRLAAKSDDVSFLLNSSKEQILGETDEPLEIVDEQPVELMEAEPAKPTLDEKLSDYYGVSQIDGAVMFVTLYPRAASVQIAGDFNNWQPQNSTMERVGKSGIWQTKVKMNPGRYRYRLVVDGQWQQDPYNEKIELNPYGGFNSVLEVK
ncbi:MAG: AAA family ATPase [Phycisphaerae bacterium]|nr:AAA family ATPase [Phycisphaerae bacterium]